MDIAHRESYQRNWYIFPYLKTSTNSGERTSTQVIYFGTLLFHGPEVNISIEFSAEVNIYCRSQQLGAEVTLVEHRLPLRAVLVKLHCAVLTLLKQVTLCHLIRRKGQIGSVLPSTPKKSENINFKVILDFQNPDYPAQITDFKIYYKECSEFIAIGDVTIG